MHTRRDVLRATLAGAATLSMPSFLAACGPKTGVVEPPVPVVPPPDTAPFLSWFGVDEANLRALLSTLSSKGATEGDVYFQHTRALSITLEDGLVSRASTTIDQGVGLRSVLHDQVGYAFSEDLSMEAMTTAAATAAAIAQSTSATASPSDFARKPLGGTYKTLVPWTSVGIDQRIPKMTYLAAAAKKLDPSVEKVTVSWSDEEQQVLIATMDGRLVVDHRPMSRVWCTITARKNGVVQSNSANLAGRRGLEHYTDARLDTLAKRAVDRTMILFEARRPKAGQLPVILAAGASGILLHEAIGHGMEADFNRKGTSIYSTMIGQKVAPDFVTVVDDGTLPNERGSLNYDDEGNPAQRTVLVDKGVMSSYLQDSISARHYKTASTGSGRRESFRYAPMPRMRATFMENGPHTREEIIASVQNGIIAETFTNGQVQIGAGDFTFYIKNGWLVENGKITAPIKDCNIIGNGPEALRNVTMVANDSVLDEGGWTCGKDGQSVPVSQGMPTVLVSALTVGGESA